MDTTALCSCTLDWQPGFDSCRRHSRVKLQYSDEFSPFPDSDLGGRYKTVSTSISGHNIALKSHFEIKLASRVEIDLCIQSKKGVIWSNSNSVA